MADSRRKRNMCDYCAEVLSEVLTITLPCGYLVCRKHVNLQQSTFDCSICPDQKINVKECLNMPVNRVKNKFNLRSDDLKLEFEEFKEVKRDPRYHVSKHYEELTNSLNFRREELKFDIGNKIDQYYDQLVKSIRKNGKNGKKILQDNIKKIDFDNEKFSQNFEHFNGKKIKFNAKPNRNDKIQFEPLNKKIELQLLKLKSIKKLYEDANKSELIDCKQIKDEDLTLEKTFGILKLNQQAEAPIPTKKRYDTLFGHTDRILCLKLLNSNQIASGSVDMRIKIWDLNTGLCKNTLIGHSEWVCCLHVLDSGDLVSGSGDNSIKIWNIKTGTCKKTFLGHSDWIWSLDSMDSRELISGSEDKSIKVWDLNTGICKMTILGHQEFVSCVRVLDPTKIVSCSGDKKIKIWNKETGKCIKEFRGHTDSIWSLQIFRKGKIISSSFDKTIKVWDIFDGICEKTLYGHTNEVRGITVVEDTGEIISASEDKTIKVWDISTGECLRTLQGHTRCVWETVVTDSGIIVSCSDDKSIKIWE